MTQQRYNATNLDVTNNPTGNWDIHLNTDGSGSVAFLNEGYQITQNVNQRLKLLFEEWVLDRTVGVPWVQRVFSVPFNLPLAESILKQHVNNTRGVVKLMSFETDMDSRNRLIHYNRCVIKTHYGDLQQEL